MQRLTLRACMHACIREVVCGAEHAPVGVGGIVRISACMLRARSEPPAPSCSDARRGPLHAAGSDAGPLVRRPDPPHAARGPDAGPRRLGAEAQASQHQPSDAASARDHRASGLSLQLIPRCDRRKHLSEADSNSHRPKRRYTGASGIAPARTRSLSRALPSRRSATSCAHLAPRPEAQAHDNKACGALSTRHERDTRRMGGAEAGAGVGAGSWEPSGVGYAAAGMLTQCGRAQATSSLIAGLAVRATESLAFALLSGGAGRAGCAAV